MAVLLAGFVPASAGQAGTGTSHIYIQNAEGSGSASVVLEFYDTDGTLRATYNVASLPPYVRTYLYSADIPGLPNPFRGSAVISSDVLVAAVARTTYSSIPGNPDGLETDDYSGFDSPANSSYLAYVFDSANRNNIIAVQNTEGTAATVYFNYLVRSTGAPIVGGAGCTDGTFTDVIPADGVVYYDLLNQTRNSTFSGGVGGKIPCMGANGTSQPAAGTLGGFEGAVYITSTNGIAATTAVKWSTYGTTYSGATDEDTTLYFPQVVRVKDGSNVWTRWSAVIIQNTKSFPISISVALIGAYGTTVFTDTVPALSSRGYNTRFVNNSNFAGDGPAYLGIAPSNGGPLHGTGCSENNGVSTSTCPLEMKLGNRNWVGAAVVRVLTANGAAVGVNHIFYEPAFGYAGRALTYEALMPGNASRVVVCPQFQDQDGNGASPYNSRYSAALVQNASAVSTAHVDVYLFKSTNTTGGLAGADTHVVSGTITTWAIPPAGRLGFNTRFGAVNEGGPPASAFDITGVAGNWEGSAVFVSQDQDILVTTTVFRLDDTANPRLDWATAYNCYNVPN